MHLNDLLTPWLLLAAVLIPLVYVEKWIHGHLYGVGWLLTNDKKSATALYYVILFPGVFVHEFTQWLVAGALNVKTRRLTSWPEAQDNGTLRLDFVQIQGAGWLRAAIIGASPLVVGMSLVWLISNQILDFGDFVDALGTGNLRIIGPALRDLAGKTDFFIWLYLMFTISNAMLPTPADRQGWTLIIGVFGLVLVFLILIGSGEVLLETFTGPVAAGVRRLSTAFLTVLLIEIPGILAIGFLEEILERITGRKFDYSRPAPSPRVREPGSNLPLRPGAPLPSVYNLNLPVPDPSEINALRAQSRRFSAAASTARPSVSSSPAQESPVASPGPRRIAPEPDRETAERQAPLEERPRIGARTLPAPASWDLDRTPDLSRDEPQPRRQPPPETPAPLREPAARRLAEDDETPPPTDRPAPFRRPLPQPAPRPAQSPFRPPIGVSPDESEDEAEDIQTTRLPGTPGPRSRPPRPFDRPLVRPSSFATDNEEDEDGEDNIEELEYIDFDDL